MRVKGRNGKNLIKNMFFNEIKFQKLFTNVFLLMCKKGRFDKKNLSLDRFSTVTALRVLKNKKKKYRGHKN